MVLVEFPCNSKVVRFVVLSNMSCNMPLTPRSTGRFETEISWTNLVRIFKISLLNVTDVSLPFWNSYRMHLSQCILFTLHFVTDGWWRILKVILLYPLRDMLYNTTPVTSLLWPGKKNYVNVVEYNRAERPSNYSAAA